MLPKQFEVVYNANRLAQEARRVRERKEKKEVKPKGVFHPTLYKLDQPMSSGHLPNVDYTVKAAMSEPVPALPNNVCTNSLPQSA